MGIPKISKKAITVIATLGVIGLVYAFYFFVYVAGKEIEYQEKAFRILDNIGHNIQEKHKNNKKNVISIVKILNRDVKVLSPQQFEADYEKLIDEYYRVLDNLNNDDMSHKEHYALEDSLAIKFTEKYDLIYSRYNDNPIDSETTLYDLINQTLGEYKINKELILFPVDTISMDIVYNTLEIIKAKNYRNLYYKTFVNPEKRVSNGDSISRAWKLVFEMSLKDFMRPLLRKDVFDELLIKRNGDTAITYQSFKNKIQLHTQDSLFRVKKGINSSRTNTITVQDTPYKAFTYSLEFDNKERWLITGCIKEKTYQTETRSISFWIIINSSLLVILLLFAMPVLKLVFMNFIERLHRSGVVLSGLSIIMGASIIVLFFLIQSNYNYDLERTDIKLDSLSKEIKTKLKNELTAIEQQLSDYDNLLSSHFETIEAADGFPSIHSVAKNRESILYPNLYNRFNEVFWMDSKGKQTLKFTLSKKANELTLLSDRDYYKHVKENKLWRPRKDGNQLFKDPIFIESIVSWSSGEHEIAVSKNGDTVNTTRYAVAAITAKFKSVIDAILPMGYGFSIISEDGNVLIHSDSNKNLQENFIEESKDDAYLRSAIYSNNELTTTIDYLGRKYRSKIMPFEGMPLFLVVYNNLDNMKTRVSEIWSTTFFLVLLSFAVLGILLLIVLIARYKASKLRTKKFFFNWMLPKIGELKSYKRLIVSNVFVIIITIVFYYIVRKDQAAIIFKLFVIPTIVFALNYDWLNFVIKDKKDKDDDDDEKLKKRKVFRRIVVYYLLAINLFYFIVFASMDNFLINALSIVFQILVIIAFIPYRKLDHWIENFKFKGLKFDNLRIIYSVFLLTWLLSSAITPVIYLYKTAYTIESKIWTKHTLLDLSRKIGKQFTNENNVFNLEDLKGETENRRDSSYHGVYHKFLGAKFLNTCDIKTYEKSQNTSFDSMLFYSRPGYRTSIIENRGLVYASAEDDSFSWKESNDYILLTHQLSDNDSIKIHLAQRLDNVNFLGVNTSFTSVLFMIIVLSLLILGLYYLISFSVNKIYCLEFSNYIKSFDDDKDLIKSIITNNNTILIGLPGSGKTALLKEHYNENKNGVLENCLIVNCITISHEEEWLAKTISSKAKKYKTIVLDNFEYKNDDYDTNSKKLKFLEELLDQKKHIVIISEIEPIEILDMYTRENTDKKEGATKNSHQDEIEIWRHTFSHFVEVYKPLKKTVLSNKNQILNELGHGTFLIKISAIIEKKMAQVKNMEDDDIILDIQHHAKSYYYALWNALTNKEKFAVYDIAKDGFINTQNRPIIHSLLKKGLFNFNRGKLRLMNKSFINFVLTVLTKEDLVKMDMEVKKKGKWVNIKLVIILVVVGLIILIGFGRPGFFKNINAILIAVAGAASVLPSLARGFSLAQKIR